MTTEGKSTSIGGLYFSATVFYFSSFRYTDRFSINVHRVSTATPLTVIIMCTCCNLLNSCQKDMIMIYS